MPGAHFRYIIARVGSLKRDQLKLSRTLLIILIVASVLPALLFRIQEWVEGTITTWPQFFESLLINSLISLVVTLSIAFVILSILSWLNKRMPWNDRLLQRLMTEIVCTFPVAIGLGYGFGNLVYLINPPIDQSYGEFIFTFLAISAVMNLILVAISDWVYFFDRWKLSLIEEEKQAKEKAVAQYEALKNQVNPHFLFNSLNVLSSLVHTDAQKAEDFIDQFAALYRYILDNTDGTLVTLEQELEIVRSYVFLQKQRFGDSVICDIDVPVPSTKEWSVFPLSVQTLVENAFKHNIASKDQPLHISITIHGSTLTVCNNLQVRSSKKKSTGIGLENLKLRYRAYGDEPRIEITDQEYAVRLPLLHHTKQLAP